MKPHEARQEGGTKTSDGHDSAVRRGFLVLWLVEQTTDSGTGAAAEKQSAGESAAGRAVGGAGSGGRVTR